VVRQVPGVIFRLLGTAGTVRDAVGVRRYFPRRLWPRLEIYPRYDPNELPGLLAGVSIGVFPSRVEGSPYGVLEMLASAIPVIAYDAPGANVLLTPEFLVQVGDTTTLTNRAVGLFDDPVRLQVARRWARNRALEFNWERIGEETARVYENRLAQRTRPNR